MKRTLDAGTDVLKLKSLWKKIRLKTINSCNLISEQGYIPLWIKAKQKSTGSIRTQSQLVWVMETISTTGTLSKLMKI